MPQLKVPCPHCHRVTAIDSEKLPDQPVSFKCPHCKGKVIADKQRLLDELEGKAPPPRPTMVSQAVSAPEAAAASSEVAEEGEGLPPGASIPPGFILGEDPATAEAIRSLLGKYDCILEAPADVEAARSEILLDPPSLLIYVAKGAAEGPPHPPMGPLVAVPPRERRKVFMVLVADNLKTLDGNAAFMYQVNLCVARSELGSIATAIYTGLDYHHRLYKPYFDASSPEVAG